MPPAAPNGASGAGLGEVFGFTAREIGEFCVGQLTRMTSMSMVAWVAIAAVSLPVRR